MDNLSLKVENIAARFEQFLLLSLCFKKPSAAEASESVCVRERDNQFDETIHFRRHKRL